MSHYHQHHSHDTHAHDPLNVSNHEHCSNRKIHEMNDEKHSNRKKLSFIMILTFAFAIVEFVGGWYSGSLALISDAFHMLTDSSSLLIALVMAIMAARPADKHYSYGQGRWEIVGALINGLFMAGVILFLLFEGINRIINPEPVIPTTIIWVAFGGLCINIFAAWLLSDSHSLNTKAALIHVLGDLLGSVAALSAGVIIYFTGMVIFDPIISILVSLILVYPTYNLLKKTFRVILDGVPEHIEFDTIGNEIKQIEGVLDVHDLHIWNMTSDFVSLSAHIDIATAEDWPEVLKHIQIMLSKKYNIFHVTIQPEIENQHTHDEHHH
jgi:cobalt-zinc-cadmium efflux system protein